MKEGRRFIIFGIHGERYALRLKDVTEVMDPPPTYPIPRAPLCFAGAVNIHGGIVTLIDPAALLSQGSSSEGGKILVLDRHIANLALKVEDVQNIIDEEAILEEEDVDDELVAREMILADGVVRLLNLDMLLEKLEGLIGAVA